VFTSLTDSNIVFLAFDR
jgi:hypothetical protein